MIDKDNWGIGLASDVFLFQNVLPGPGAQVAATFSLGKADGA